MPTVLSNNNITSHTQIVCMKGVASLTVSTHLNTKHLNKETIRTIQNLTGLPHSNTELVCYLDPYCTELTVALRAVFCA